MKDVVVFSGSQNSTRRVVAVDFFCGAGGLTRGLLDAGILVLAGIDNDIRLRETYEKNNSPSVFIAKDIQTLNIIEIRKLLGIQTTDIVVYAACAPCQPFSTLARKRIDDDRKELLLSFGALVRISPPDFIIVENVPGLHNTTGRDVFNKFCKILDDAGFSTRSSEQLNTEDYGVAQARKRFLMIASRHGYIEKLQKAEHRLTVRDVIKKFPPLQAGEFNEKIPNHKTQTLSPHLLQIVRAVPKDGGSRRDIKDPSILLKCHQGKPNVHKDVFGRMAWNAPAPTITCRCLHVYCGRFTHPEQDRAISLREAAAIQSFADDFVFYGQSDMHIAKQIGNAVPVELAKRVGLAIVRASKKIGETK